ncbi:MAG: hypothetical protein AABZ55_13500 [Bdellovibrionota bacterium]
MAGKKSFNRTKAKVSQVLNHAKDSLKILEMLEKETIAKAKSFIQVPLGSDPRKKTNEKINLSLKKLGIATKSDLDALKARIEKLEAQFDKNDSTKDPHTEMSGTLPQG